MHILTAQEYSDISKSLKRAREALNAYQKYNYIRNDTDAYLHALGGWALLGDEHKPNPKDYGLE